MKKGNQIFENHTPNFTTFPLAQNMYRKKDDNECEAEEPMPAEWAVEEVKAWVDFKEM